MTLLTKFETNQSNQVFFKILRGISEICNLCAGFQTIFRITYIHLL